jgi:hypothetical protein
MVMDAKKTMSVVSMAPRIRLSKCVEMDSLEMTAETGLSGDAEPIQASIHETSRPPKVRNEATTCESVKLEQKTPKAQKAALKQTNAK